MYMYVVVVCVVGESVGTSLQGVICWKLQPQSKILRFARTQQHVKVMTFRSRLTGSRLPITESGPHRGNRAGDVILGEWILLTSLLWRIDRLFASVLAVALLIFGGKGGGGCLTTALVWSWSLVCLWVSNAMYNFMPPSCLCQSPFAWPQTALWTVFQCSVYQELNEFHVKMFERQNTNQWLCLYVKKINGCPSLHTS